MMKTDTIDSEIIDPDLDSYRQFFDHAWCGHIFGLVEHSSLKPAVETLMLAWRSTDGAHRLPWLMVEQLRCFGEGEVKGSLRYRDGYFRTVVKGLSEKLEAWTPSMNFPQRTEQRRAVTRIEEEAAQALKTAQAQVRIDVEQYWTQLIGNSEFVFSILGLQRSNYGSLFFAYEDFLANTIRTKEPAYSSRNTPIKNALPTHFGEPLADSCWNHAEVDLARLVRNAVVHNSGRLGADLDKYKERFMDATGMSSVALQGDRFNVVNGTIQITPCNTRYLFDVLKDRVTEIVEKAA